MVQHVPYDGYGNVRYDELGPAAVNASDVLENGWYLPEEVNPEEFARLNAERNKRLTTQESAPSVVKSRIRIQLSRDLTWAEKEALEKDDADTHNRKLDGKHTFDGLKVWTSPERTHVWAEAPYGSRPLYELLASVLANQFVNVYPTAVRTFREYNGE